MSNLLTNIDPISAYPSRNIYRTCKQIMSPSSHNLPVQTGLTSVPKIQINIKYFPDIITVAVKASHEGLKLYGSQHKAQVYVNEVIYCVKTYML
jgi:hypothetical protein